MSVEQLEAEIEALLSDLDDETAALARANGKLFEAGKFAGQQQAKITAALGYLEKAHQAVHKADPLACLQAIADAMQALA